MSLKYRPASCEEEAELAAADAAAAAEEAAYQARLKRQGFPRAAACLGCDAPVTIHEPGDRLCQRCRAAE
jgi:hypothetical protein